MNWRQYAAQPQQQPTGAQAIIDGLVQRGVPLPAAIGFAGNFQVESRLDPGINEIAPLVPGSRGGFGLAQWTGPRRRQLEAFAQDRGVPVSDMGMQLDFLMHELGTTESRARDRIFSAQTPEEAARAVSESFLRPGIPHLDRRLAAAREFAGLAPSSPEQTAPQMPQNAPQAPVNALAAIGQPEAQAPAQNVLALAYQGLDPSQFMSRRRF